MDNILTKYELIKSELDKATSRLEAVAIRYPLYMLDDNRLSPNIAVTEVEAVSSGYINLPLLETLRKLRTTLFDEFKIALVGEFSRGKTTLINTLLQRDLLITNFRPNTATRTMIRHGIPSRFRVEFVDERVIEQVTEDISSHLTQYTSDTSDQDSEIGRLKGEQLSLAMQVRSVEIWSDFPFLVEHGFELIDSPGLGSVFAAHQPVTYSVIPKVDVVVFVVQIDPGIGSEETLFLGSVQEHLAKFMFVMTKADMADSSKHLSEQIDFMQTVLREQVGIKSPVVYAVSSSKAAKHWDNSGFPEFIAALDKFVVCSAGRSRLEFAVQHLNGYLQWLSVDIHRRVEQIDIPLDFLQKETQTIQASKERLKALQVIDLEHIKYTIDTIFNQLSLNDLLTVMQQAVEQSIAQGNFQNTAEIADKVFETTLRTVEQWMVDQSKAIIEQCQPLSNYLTMQMQWLGSEAVSISTDLPLYVMRMSRTDYPPELLTNIWRLIGIMKRVGLEHLLHSTIYGTVVTTLNRPIENQSLSFYRIVLYGIQFVVTANQGRTVTVKGLREDLQATLNDWHSRLQAEFEINVNHAYARAFETMELEQERVKNQCEELKRHKHTLEKDQVELQQVHQVLEQVTFSLANLA